MSIDPEDLKQDVTREGNRILVDLAKKGWKAAPFPPRVVGEPDLIDPVDGKHYPPTEAERIQAERDKGSKGISTLVSGEYTCVDAKKELYGVYFVKLDAGEDSLGWLEFFMGHDYEFVVGQKYQLTIKGTG